MHVLSTPPAFILSQDQTLCKNVCSGPRQPLGYLFPFYCFKGQFLEFFTSRRSLTSRKKLILEIFQGCFTVQLSMFFCWALVRRNSDIISRFQAFVNRFFKLFLKSFWRISKRRRRDLNPRAAINDLHPFQGCPFGQLGYFSMPEYTVLFTCIG